MQNLGLGGALPQFIMSQVFAAINHRLSDEYAKIELPSQEAKERYAVLPVPFIAPFPSDAESLDGVDVALRARLSIFLRRMVGTDGGSILLRSRIYTFSSYFHFGPSAFRKASRGGVVVPSSSSIGYHLPVGPPSWK